VLSRSQALVHLYDYERLRDLPLGRWLRAEPGYTGKGTLHQMLRDAIQALRQIGRASCRERV